MTTKKKGRPKGNETPYTKSAVAQVRVATGLTKVEFRTRCGINAATYQTIERSGHEKGTGVSAQYAYQIAAATGASPGHLMNNQARVMDGSRKYTHTDFQSHQEMFGYLPKKWMRCLMRVVQTRYDHIAEHLENKLESGDAFVSMVFALSFELDMMAAKFGVTHGEDGKRLEPAIEELISEIQMGISEGMSQSRGRSLEEHTSRWDIIGFFDRMRKAEETARLENKKSRANRKLKSSRRLKRS